MRQLGSKSTYYNWLIQRLGLKKSSNEHTHIFEKQVRCNGRHHSFFTQCKCGMFGPRKDMNWRRCAEDCPVYKEGLANGPSKD